MRARAAGPRGRGARRSARSGGQDAEVRRRARFPSTRFPWPIHRVRGRCVTCAGRAERRTDWGKMGPGVLQHHSVTVRGAPQHAAPGMAMTRVPYRPSNAGWDGLVGGDQIARVLDATPPDRGPPVAHGREGEGDGTGGYRRRQRQVAVEPGKRRRSRSKTRMPSSVPQRKTSCPARGWQDHGPRHGRGARHRRDAASGSAQQRTLGPRGDSRL